MYRLLHGDCLDLMPALGAGSVDLILADLPYGTTACKWDSIIPLEPLWQQYKRLLKPRGAVVLTASQPFTTTLIASNRAWFRYTWVWDKVRGGNMFLAKHQPMKVHEDIVIFSPRRSRYTPQMIARDKVRQLRNTRIGEAIGGDTAITGVVRAYKDVYPRSIIEFSNAYQYNKVHPTQKPVALMEYLIRTYSNEGDLVLDNTMGSGTTGVACLNTGRRFIGIEKDAGYFAIAERRMCEASTAARQERLEIA